MRKYREEINDECERWGVIIGFRHKNPKKEKKDTRGYYLCDTKKKLDEYIINMYAQAKNMRMQADRASIMYGRLMNPTQQESFDFDGKFK